MEILDKYLSLQKEIFDHFGYVEDWVVIPIDDRRQMYWHLDQVDDCNGTVAYHDKKEVAEARDGNHYENDIYTQRFLPKWVYRAPAYTMICVDTHTDGNKFLAIYDNSKEVD